MLSTRPRIDWNTEFIPSHEVLCLWKGNTIHTLLLSCTKKWRTKKITAFNGPSAQGGLDLVGCDGTSRKMRYWTKIKLLSLGNSARAVSAIVSHFLQVTAWKQELLNCQENLGLSSANFSVLHSFLICASTSTEMRISTELQVPTPWNPLLCC